jgi:hypothetical protein
MPIPMSKTHEIASLRLQGEILFLSETSTYVRIVCCSQFKSLRLNPRSRATSEKREYLTASVGG